MSSALKILVCYHKPAKLFKDDVFVPIHCGRSCCSLPEDEQRWMQENMIGDDTGDNISVLNPHFAEITATYWAWKNYDRIGEPDYIGLCHYRRLFEEKDIENYADYDITAPSENNISAKTCLDVWKINHGTLDLENALDLFVSLYPQYTEIVFSYLRQSYGYYYNMFIMKKEIFFEYCEKIFPVLFVTHQNIDYSHISYYNQRIPGFIAERLTGIFIAEKNCKAKKCQCIHIEQDTAIDIFPRFGKDGITVCFSADNNYAPYLAVTIASIKFNRNAEDKYDICILDNNIEYVNKKRILYLQDDNFSIRFIPIRAYLSEIDASIFSLNSHFTEATYYRFFIPKIFNHFDKVLYMDCDLVVHHNLAELYHTELDNYALAAVMDIEIHRHIMQCKLIDDKFLNYLTHILNLKQPEKYFQAGVLLLDIKKLQEMNFTSSCLKKLIEIQNPLYVDQCVINSIFDGNYQPLDMKWNVLWQLPYYVKNLEQQLSYVKYIEYFSACKNPYIVHYASEIKPWNNPEIDLADLWWKYARLTPFYEEVLYKDIKIVIHDLINYPKIRFNYYRCKILSKITLGKRRRHYKIKRQELKAKLKTIKKLRELRN